MSLSLTKAYKKSDYETDLENSINTNLSSISSDITTLQTAVDTLESTVSADMSAASLYTAITVSSAIYTVNLTTYRNFTITVSITDGATFKITNSPTAANTVLDFNVKLTFTALATITYTGTVTWSGGTVPTPTAAGTFLINMKSHDAGANWYASYTGEYYA